MYIKYICVKNIWLVQWLSIAQPLQGNAGTYTEHSLRSEKVPFKIKAKIKKERKKKEKNKENYTLFLHFTEKIKMILQTYMPAQKSQNCQKKRQKFNSMYNA